MIKNEKKIYLLEERHDLNLQRRFSTVFRSCRLRTREVSCVVLSEFICKFSLWRAIVFSTFINKGW